MKKKQKKSVYSRGFLILGIVIVISLILSLSLAYCGNNNQTTSSPSSSVLPR